MKSILLILLSSSVLSCSATIQNKKDTVISLEKQAEQLKSSYQKLTSTYNKEVYEQEYFNAFPDSFSLLNKLVGYSEKEPLGNDFNYAPLYEEAHQFIIAFYNLTTIGNKDFLQKVINICINGRWYADGVNYFQHGMKEKIKNNLTVFCELLSAREDNEIKSFWHFYFDGPIIVKEIPEELQKLEQINNRVYILMNQELKEMQKE